MSFIDAQGCTFSFDGQIVGKITGFQINDGTVPDIEFKGTNKNGTIFFPGQADWGSITLRLYRDFTDAGQNAMELARETRKKVTCLWTLSDGTTRTFLGYVKRLPIVGDDNGLGTADAVIKVAGRPS